MSEWISCEFSSLYAEPSRNGLTKPKRVRGHGVKFVNMGEIFRCDRLKDLKCDRVPLIGNEKFLLLKDDDLLFARQSLVLSGAGKCSIFLGDFEDVTFESHIIRVRLDNNKADPLFYYYLFRSPQGRSLIEAIVEQGAGASGIRGSDLQSLIVPYTLLSEQKAIASILSSLDDKIELNRRMNETLEAMARAIFKDWFVDFGPTRAKQAGRAAYLPEPLWSLFPGAIDEETGLPQGWEEKALDEIADFLNGLALQKYPPLENEEPLPVIKIAELRSGITEKSGRASRTIPEKYIVKDGDFLFSWSGSLVAKFWTEGEGALNQHLFKVTSADYPIWFFTQWTYHHLEDFQRIAAAKATTMGHIQRGHLTAAKVTCPESNLMNSMSDLMNPLAKKTIENSLESRTLAELRDRLLPKLMSGEIRVKDAEKMVEDAV